jgi:hypothetical protein
MCHTAVPALNDFGVEVVVNLPGVYEETLPEALAASEAADSDADGVSNLEEILLGTLPGDPQSVFVTPPAPSGDPNPTFDLGDYDVTFAFKRMHQQFCGCSPTRAQLDDLAAAGDAQQHLHDELTACLDSDYWKNEGLMRLADKRIRPLEAIGVGGVIPLADFNWDYRLFSHVLTGDRPATDLLLADYHVDEAGNVVSGVIDDGDIDQPLEPQFRAGMITTQWFLMIHTMFSELPRTTAAQAYRAYLDQDIAKSQGLLPVEGEPIDIDNKGVTQPDCANCHSTLDPLSYAFAYYGGIEGGGTGAFNPDRPSWDSSEVTSSLFDTELPDPQTTGVVPWAEQAAASEAFRRNLALMFFTHAAGGPPTPDDLEELKAIWQGLDADFTAADLIHQIVDTDAFGAP